VAPPRQERYVPFVPPYWLLIAVLQSTVPLEPALAMRLYHAAVELHRSEDATSKLTGELAMGEVRRLGKELLIGSIGGPGFEADLDTPKGSGRVRFILTRQGLDEAQAQTQSQSPSPSRSSLPN
jgi:hypothetical protein